MHMKELSMFTYNLWIDCLHPDKSCQLFCPVINIAMSNNLNTLMCTLHIFSSNKARFIHTSTITILHSCPGKKICVRIACILFLYKNQYFWTFLRQNIQQKVLAFHSVLNFSWEHAPNPSCSKPADTILYYYCHIKEEHFKMF